MKSNEVKISVIVPVYNVERYLDRCVTSIVKQTYNNLEIILVDDGSTDSSGRMCDSFKDNRIKVIHKKNEGLGKARNSGIKYSTGRYIMFVDSDDYIDDTMVENLYDDLQRNKADTCIGGFKRVFANKTEKHVNYYAGKTLHNDEILNNILVKMFGKNSKIDDHVEMSAWKVLFDSQIIKQYNILFPSEREFISEDIIFDTEYFPKTHTVTMSDDVGYNYCDNDDSLTTKYNPVRFNLQKVLFQELIRRSKAIGVYDVAYQRILDTFVANIRYCIKLDQKFLPRLDAKSKVTKICHDKIVQIAMRDHRVDDGIKSNSINFLIRTKQINLLLLIMKIKNKLGI